MAAKNEKTVDGVRAVEMYYRVIRDISSGSCAFYQSQTRLNTPGMGTLMPENFRDVAEVTRQCISLFELEYVQALEAVQKFTERELRFKWVSVYMPPKYLLEPGVEKKLVDVTERLEVPTTKICFALSEKLFEETDHAISENIKKLRNRGFHFMLTDFGGEGSPVMRLSEFEVDHVMLSPEITRYIGRDERSNNAVKALIDFASDLNAEPIADGVQNVQQAERLYEFECMYCAGSLAGKYIAERYIRRRSEEAAEQR
ncbi:MAG: EAL domain-containing protein [Ruminococcus sp.]|nr:EAL domain-containing protein [Ruminococcus sp.]